MNDEYIDDLAIDLHIKRSILDQLIAQPGIDTHCIAASPTDLNVALATDCNDVQRLHGYHTQTGTDVVMSQRR